MIESQYNLICILGPTASGKTTVAAHLAKHLDSGIISADSRQVYRNMDIGTGKDLKDYTIGGQKIPFSLIDIREAGAKYNVFEFQKDFMQVFSEYKDKNKIPVMCGGSGLYLESILKSYELQEVPINESLRIELEQKPFEELIQVFSSYKNPHNKSDFDTKKRLIRAIEIEDYQQKNEVHKSQHSAVKSLIIGIRFEREEQKKRITERLHSRIKEGMIEEVKSLLEKGIPPQDLIYYGLEYKYITLYLKGQLDYETMLHLLNIAIHQFSKRQMTWFRKMEREGYKINWIDGNFSLNEKMQRILSLL